MTSVAEALDVEDVVVVVVVSHSRLSLELIKVG